MTLKIHLLGQFKISNNEQPLDLPSRPAQSLLAYLVLNPGFAHRREKLAGLLWPDSTETNARNYLRQALWRIRKAIESGSLHWENFLVISRINVTFNPSADYWLDADYIIKKDVPAGELVGALEHYQGELLPGFYDEWTTVERNRLQAAYQQKISLLVESLVQAARWDQVLEWSEHWLRHTHTSESPFKAMMQAYASLGDQSMVRSTYERCVETLERELGVEPSIETRELLDELTTQGATPPSSPEIAPSRSTLHRPPFLDEPETINAEEPTFVARELELTQLDEYLGDMLEGKAKVAFITGEAGSGKTALLNEFSRRTLLTHPDLVIASGNCNAHTGPGDPYLPLREILGQLTGDVEARLQAGALTMDHGNRLWNLLPLSISVLIDAGPGLIGTFIASHALINRATANPPEADDWQARLQKIDARGSTSLLIQSPQQIDLFEQYTRFLQVLSREVPLVIILDDLQWADTGSIDLLAHIGSHITGCRILILGTYRQEEVAAGKDKDRHPLETVVNEFQRNFGTQSLDLGKADRQMFLEALLDSEPNQLDKSFRDILYHQTRGHPLFTIELLRGMQERGDLVQDHDGCWIEGAQLDWERMPARVEAVIAERIARLPQALQEILRVASVEGEVFTAEVIASVLGHEETFLLSQLSGELDRKHRVIRAQSITRINSQIQSSYRFRHILFQRYLYSSLDHVERVHLHERIGQVIEDLNESQERLTDVALQLARHFEEASIPAKAIHYLNLAGERAIHLAAHQEGTNHLQRALDLLQQQPESPERDQQELNLQLSIGIIWKYDWGSLERREALHRARELSNKLARPDQLSRALGELSIYHYVQAEPLKALEFARDASDLAEQANDPVLMVEAQWYLGFIKFCLGDFIEARAHIEQVITYYRPDQHHRSLILRRGVDAGLSAMSYYACCLWCLGYPEQAAQRSQEAIRTAYQFEHPFTVADVLSYSGCMFNSMRRDAEALRRYATSLIQLSTDVSLFSGWLGLGTTYLGEANALEGNMQEAIDRLGEGLETGVSTGVRLYRPIGLCALSMTYLDSGKPEQALPIIEEALALVEETSDRTWEAEILRIRGEIFRALGEEAQAEASFTQSIDIAQRQQAKSWELRASISLARLWGAQGKLKQAKKMLSEIYSWFTEGLDTQDLREARTFLDEH